MYYKLPVKERMELMKSYRKTNKDMSYSDMVKDYNNSYEKFGNGGKVDLSKIKLPHIPTSQIEAEDMIKKGLISTKRKVDENGDDDGENVFEIFDPTGISSWDDVYRSYKNTGVSWETGLETLGALPLIGKIGKSGKIITGGFGMLQNTLKAAKYLPVKTQEKVVNTAYDAYQSYVKMGGKNIDNLLAKPVELLKNNIPYINPEKWKSSQIAINTANKLFKVGKVSDAYQAYDQYKDYNDIYDFKNSKK